MDELARRLMDAASARRPVEPFSRTEPGFDIARAYRVSAALHAARLARGERLADEPEEAVPDEDGDPPLGMPRELAALRRPDWPDDLARIVYVDRFGNAMTGLRADALDGGARLGVGGHHVAHARTFSDVPPGTAFWYENSNGLIEIAVNQGRADATLSIRVGTPVEIG